MRLVCVGALFLLVAEAASGGPGGGETEPLERWVDASAPGGGDGRKGSPFRTLSEAFASGGGRIHLATGMYPGPFVVPPNTVLEGADAVVLYAEGAEEVLTVEGPLVLRKVHLQGGRRAVRSQTSLELVEVVTGGQREVAIAVEGGQLRVERSRLGTSFSGTDGILMTGETKAQVLHSEFVGPFRRALSLREEGRVEVQGCHFEGTEVGVHQVGGQARVVDSSFQGTRGPALYVSRGELSLERVSVAGHEYGLQSGTGATVRVGGFSSLRAERAGIALTLSQGVLEDVTVSQSGTLAGIQLISSRVQISRFWVHAASGYALQGREANLTLSDGVLTRTKRAEREGEGGDAIHLRGSNARIHSVAVRQAEGAALLAAEASDVSVRDLLVEGAKLAGVSCEARSRVQGHSILVKSSPGAALVAQSDGEIRVDALTVEDVTGALVWADCEAGAKVFLGRVKGEQKGGKGQPCVHSWTHPSSLERRSKKTPF